MRYRIKRVGTGQYYPEFSRFGIFWSSCYNDVTLIPETVTPHAYGTFGAAVEAADRHRQLNDQNARRESVEITEI